MTEFFFLSVMKKINSNEASLAEEKLFQKKMCKPRENEDYQ